MTTTVAVDGWNVTADEPAEDMLAALTPPKDEDPQPRVTVQDGEPVPEDPDAKVKEAAAELGKRGGKAAAEARKAAEKEKPAAKEPEPEPEETAEQKAAADRKAREGNPRHDPKARIAQLAREKREVEAAAEQERRRAAALEARLAEIERKVAPPAAERPAEPQKAAGKLEKPDPNNYETHDEYLDARDEYNRQKWDAEQQDRQRAAAVQQQAHAFVAHIQQVANTHAERVAQASESDPDFLSRVTPDVAAICPSIEMQPGEPLQASHIVADEIIRSEKGPALMLHFSAHPDEFQRILALRTRTRDEIEEVKFEVRHVARSLGAATGATSPRTRVSQAPSPVRPPTGAPPTAADSDPAEGDSYDEHFRKMNAKERRGTR